MAQWKLAVDATALRPCAAIAAHGRITALDLNGPVATAEQLLRTAAETAAAGGHTVAGLVIVHPLGWTEAEFSQAQLQARAADLPDPHFTSGASALARYFRARLALPEGACLAVYDARRKSAEVSVQSHTATGLQPVAQDIFPGMTPDDAGPGRLDQARRRVIDESASGIDHAALGPGRLAAVYLTGQAALLPGAADRVRTELGLTAFVCDRPEEAAALGALVPPDDARFRLPAAREIPASASGTVPVPDVTLHLADPAAKLAAAALSAAAVLGAAAPDGTPPAHTCHPDTLRHRAAPATDGRDVSREEVTEASTLPSPSAERTALADARTVTAGPAHDRLALLRKGGSTAGSVTPGPSSHGIPALPPRGGGFRIRSVWLPAVAAVVAATGITIGVVHWLLPNDHPSRAHTQRPRALPTTPAPAVTSPVPAPAATTIPPTPSPSLSPGTSSPKSPSESASATSPSGIVLAYYAAINKQDYTTAWKLGGDNLGGSFASFVHGFATTTHDAVTAQDTGPTQSSVDLTATQTDGSVKRFTGIYNVSDGVITSGHLQAVP
ncbi:hypothetical protein ACIF83_29790 [Streptomyces sp. NPDC085866]|uniref:hypothetical protein n=1 Tax=Streptomyces sp. NPDC085866 TaxID=3365736 RepID=UPI0037D27BE0